MKIAAGIFPYCPETKRFLIAQRGPNISDPNLWACFGGGADEGESVEETALREFREESGYQGQVKLSKVRWDTYNKKDRCVFYTYLGYVPKEFIPSMVGQETIDGDIETQAAKWVTVKQLEKLLDNQILHKGFNRFLYSFLKVKIEESKMTKKQLVENKIRNIVKKTLKEAQFPFSAKDSLIHITFEDVMDALDSNYEESQITPTVVMSEFNDILRLATQDAKYDLKEKMDYITGKKK
jgi:8-oxo-dGTP pyrophosphatase MutT (NUDIX family)